MAFSANFLSLQNQYSFIISTPSVEVASEVDAPLPYTFIFNQSNAKIQSSSVETATAESTHSYTITFNQIFTQTSAVVQDPETYTVKMGQSISLGLSGFHNVPAQAHEFVATTSYQEIDVTLNAVSVNMVLLYINGLIQSQSSYTINSNIISIPASMNVVAGDLISIIY